jgi:hypothetical protein
MRVKWIGLYGILAVLLCVAPLVASAQDDPRRFRPEESRDRPRGVIQVTNDWQDEVKVTMWTHQREQISGHWIISPGVTTMLAVDGDRIRVRPNYKIKVGDDWGWVNVGDVARFSRGTWYVNVRDVWRATHRGQGRDRDRRESRMPDWQR